MAQIGKIDESRQVVQRFLVHGSKVRLCQLGREQEDDQRCLQVRPGMLQDFLDSEVSGPLYQVKDPQAVPAKQRELVWLNYKERTRSPLTEVPDENQRDEQEREPAPQWLEVEDEVMDEIMLEHKARCRVRN